MPSGSLREALKSSTGCWPYRRGEHSLIETATVLCKSCGLTGHMEREDRSPVLRTFNDPREARRLCKSPPIQDCPHWKRATQEAEDELRPPTSH
jgi:hypothetical protein